MRLPSQALPVYILKCAALAVLYYFAGNAGRAIDFSQEGARVLLPQSGVALAGLLILGVRCWPGVLLGSFMVTGFSPTPVASPMVLGFAIGNTLGAVAGAWGLRRWGGFDLRLQRLRDIYLFLLIGVFGAPLISATVAVAVFWFTEGVAPSLALILWCRRWFGHSISNLVLAPVLLVWSRPPALRWKEPRILEALLLLSALILVCQGVFTGQSAFRELTYPLSFAPFPFLIWAALRLGPRGATTATLTVAIIAIFGLSNGQGPFIRGATDQPLVVLQIYITALAISALFLSAAITERQASEAALIDSREQLRALSAHLESSREEERARISREIHDELGQVLTGIKMGLHGLVKKLPPDELKARRKGESLIELTDEAVNAVRRIATDLRPGILDDLGLQESIKWLVADFREKTGINIRFHNSIEGLVVDRDRTTALFRILQEALTNVARHAQAEHVEVFLEREHGWLVLTVEDDGTGIPSNKQPSGGLGLIGMAERAALLGGTTVVENRGGSERGTRVRARVSL